MEIIKNLKQKSFVSLLVLVSILVLAAFQASSAFAKEAPSITYNAHVENIGWQDYVRDGVDSGTKGKALRLEGLHIKLENAPHSGGIVYKSHVENIGWQNYVADGSMSGTEGKALQLEGIRIELTGDMAKFYDVYYQTHVENFGWMGWAKNGETAGSTGYAHRMEGIRIVLVDKGAAAPPLEPGSASTPFSFRPSVRPELASLIGVTDTMQNPEFWINTTSGVDDVIMSSAQIEAFNTRIVENKELTDCVNLEAFPNSLSRSQLIAYIEERGIPEESRYIGATLASKSYYRDLFAKRNAGAVADNNPVRFGMLVDNADLRAWPTMDPSFLIPDDVDEDDAQISLLKTGEQVAVLHESVDKNWCFVQAYNYCGWVQKDKIGFSTREIIQSQRPDDEYLIIMGSKVTPLDYNQENQKITETLLLMGTRLRLAFAEAQNGHWIVDMPIRTQAGDLEFQQKAIPVDYDVHKGFLEYTKRNILMQAFKTLDDPYDWGGKNLRSTDCSALIMNLFQCMGLEMPRDANTQALIPGGLVDLSQMTPSNKLEYIKTQPPGSIIEMRGHTTLYIGSYDGEAYIFHQVYVVNPVNGTGNDYVKRSLITRVSLTKTGGGTPYLNTFRRLNTLR